jgi:hypothetical protein
MNLDLLLSPHPACLHYHWLHRLTSLADTLAAIVTNTISATAAKDSTIASTVFNSSTSADSLSAITATCYITTSD